MTHPASVRASPVPSISRLFAAAFLVIAVAGLADRIAIWRSARRAFDPGHLGFPPSQCC